MYFLGICKIFSDIIIVSEFGAPVPIRPPPKHQRERNSTWRIFPVSSEIRAPLGPLGLPGPPLALPGPPWADWGDLGENESNLIRFSAGSSGGSGDSGGRLGLLR